MAILTAGITVWPYGEGGRLLDVPVKASVYIAEGAFVAQINGAAVPGTTAGAGDAIGVAMMDQTGGGSDGTKRISVMHDRTFIMAAGVAAPTDFTPIGTLLYMEDDHTVGTGGLGAGQKIAGKFVGIEDDGRVRVYVGIGGSGDSSGAEDEQVTGTPVPNAAATTVQRVGRVSKYLVATLGQTTTVTLGTTGAVVGDVMRIIRTDASAFTLAVVNGGAGAGTLATLVASKVGFLQAVFDGTNWLYDGSSAT